MVRIHELVERCRDAATTQDPVTGVMEVLGAFLHQPNLERRLGRADRSTYEALYRGRDLLVLHGVVPPTPRPVDPHDHRMWAVIGVYHGREDNQLFARTDDAALEPTERYSLSAGEIRPLDASTIHSVQATGGRYLGAVHVYGGDLFGTPRDGVEQPNDESALPAFFERLRGSRGCARTSDAGRGDHRAALVARDRSRLSSPSKAGADPPRRTGLRACRRSRRPWSRRSRQSGPARCARPNTDSCAR